MVCTNFVVACSTRSRGSKGEGEMVYRQVEERWSRDVSKCEWLIVRSGWKNEGKCDTSSVHFLCMFVSMSANSKVHEPFTSLGCTHCFNCHCEQWDHNKYKVWTLSIDVRCWTRIEPGIHHDQPSRTTVPASLVAVNAYASSSLCPLCTISRMPYALEDVRHNTGINGG